VPVRKSILLLCAALLFIGFPVASTFDTDDVQSLNAIASVASSVTRVRSTEVRSLDSAKQEPPPSLTAKQDVQGCDRDSVTVLPSVLRC
jgi:hypothetical protein